MAVIRLISRQLVFGIGRQVEVDLRQRLFEHMLRQEPNWVQTTGSGEVISRATSDVENIRRLLGFAILSLTNTLLAYTMTLPAMLAIDPKLTLAAVGLYPLMLGTVRLFGGRMMRQQRAQQEELAGLSNLIQEDLSGIGAIKIYGQEASEQDAFSGLNRRYRDSAIRLARTRSTLSREFHRFRCCCCSPSAAGNSKLERSASAVWLLLLFTLSNWFFPLRCWDSP
jgi:ATP-binding cassette subfamily B protein